MSNEDWRPVVGWEDFYLISSLGRVWSRPRLIQRPTTGGFPWPGGYVKVHLNGRGYPYVGLCANGRQTRKTTHLLILEAFVGPRPAGAHACHNDGVQTNSVLDNLRWDSVSGNMIDVVKHGRHAESNQIACYRGHFYVRFNLPVTFRGLRQCRSCSLANSAAYRARRRGAPEPDREALSHAYYAELCRKYGEPDPSQVVRSAHDLAA